MSHYKPYPAYKDSCVEWIGDVPEHWEVKSFKRVASIRNGQDYKHVEATEGDFPVIGSGGEFARASAFLFNGESVLLGRKGTIDKPLYMNGPFWAVDTMFFTEIAPTAHAKYIYYTALNIPFGMYSTNTALPSMTQEALSNHIIAVPKLNEQSQIAAALDRETTRIDALIIKKTRFIELLKEKRTALITHAVTKGLNPKVKMKDSGVEWIGKMPEHWVLSKLKYISRALIGLTYAPEDVVDNGSGITVLRSTNIQDGMLDMTDTVQVCKDIGKELMAQVGDILICSRNGSRALIGKNIQLDERSLGCTFGAFMTVLRGKYNDYLYYVLNSTMFDANSALYMTSTVNQLTISMIDNMEVPLPPKTEQKIIVLQLRKALMSLDTLSTKTQRSINLLKERRSAFITAAVTGQIDLRETI